MMNGLYLLVKQTLCDKHRRWLRGITSCLAAEHHLLLRGLQRNSLGAEGKARARIEARNRRDALNLHVALRRYLAQGDRPCDRLRSPGSSSIVRHGHDSDGPARPPRQTPPGRPAISRGRTRHGHEPPGREPPISCLGPPFTDVCGDDGDVRQATIGCGGRLISTSLGYSEAVVAFRT
jgi:hypothetical protein